MINKKKKYVGRLTLAAAITSILFSGCGAAQKELAQTDRASYEKISYQTVTVQSGSLTPQTTISLSAQGYTRFSYGATNTELTLEKVNVAVGDHVKKGDILVAFKSGEIQKISYQTVTVQSGSLTPQTTISLSAQGYTRFSYGATNTELTLEKVNVAVGDHVKKGDILVAFKSGEIQKKIEDYSGQISQNKLLAEHYRAIMKIDDTQDYSSDIAQLDKDTEVAQLYLDEAKEKLSRYQITASEDGTITAMNNSLLAGVFEPGSNLITEISGNGNYEADRPEGYDFNVGDVYTATASDIEFELKVKEVDDKKLVFEPVSDMSAVSDAQIFSMEVTRPAIENAVYVQKDAVHEKDGRYFVYTLDENGYRQAVWISVGDQVGDYRIITEGLKSGDEVVLQ